MSSIFIGAHAITAGCCARANMAALTPQEQFARGLHAALAPGVQACDEAVRNALESQLQLHAQISRLSGALDAFGRNYVPSVLPHVHKLQDARARLAEIATKLQRVERRVESIKVLGRKHGILPPLPPAEAATAVSPTSTTAAPPPASAPAPAPAAEAAPVK
jgi:hypothetical protein